MFHCLQPELFTALTHTTHRPVFTALTQTTPCPVFIALTQTTHCPVFTALTQTTQADPLLTTINICSPVFTVLTHTDNTLLCVHNSDTDNIGCFIAHSQKCSQSCVHSSDSHKQDTAICSRLWHRQYSLFHCFQPEMFTVLCSQL